MSWVDGEWYPCTVQSFDYIKSPEKGTPGFQMLLQHPENGKILGVWWLSNTIGRSGAPAWKTVMDRLLKLGCNDAELRGADWVEHARKNVVGKELSACVEIDDYGAKAKFIGISNSKASSDSGFPVASSDVPSPFGGSGASTDPFNRGVDDGDVPF